MMDGVALAAARAAESVLLAGEAVGPLHGVPLSIKDVIWMRGVPATNGAVAFRDFHPAEDAVVVRRLRAAGAIPVGKTNNAELCMHFPTDNAVHGLTRNPWDLALALDVMAGPDARTTLHCLRWAGVTSMPLRRRASMVCASPPALSRPSPHWSQACAERFRRARSARRRGLAARACLPRHRRRLVVVEHDLGLRRVRSLRLAPRVRTGAAASPYGRAPARRRAALPEGLIRRPRGAHPHRPPVARTIRAL